MKAGDTVYHKPSGEKWIVAYVDGDYLSWCGWPPGEARVSDCELISECSHERHLHWLREIAKSDGKRASMARRTLEGLLALP